MTLKHALKLFILAAAYKDQQESARTYTVSYFLNCRTLLPVVFYTTLQWGNHVTPERQTNNINKK